MVAISQAKVVLLAVTSGKLAPQALGLGDGNEPVHMAARASAVCDARRMGADMLLPVTEMNERRARCCGLLGVAADPTDTPWRFGACWPAPGVAPSIRYIMSFQSVQPSGAGVCGWLHALALVDRHQY